MKKAPTATSGPELRPHLTKLKVEAALIHISAIVLAELYYLNAKHSFPIQFADELKKFEAGTQFVLTAVESDDIVEFDKDQAVSEMHDRIIVGLARRLNAPLLTVDQNIASSNLVEVLW